MKESSMLTVIDLTWSYYSLKISDLSACLTGFYSGIPSDFILAWTRTPMGISPSSGFLQAAVTYALSPVKDNVINYSDNILVHSSPEKHADVLAKPFLCTGHNTVLKDKVAISTIFCSRSNTVLKDEVAISTVSSLPIQDTLL